MFIIPLYRALFENSLTMKENSDTWGENQEVANKIRYKTSTAVDKLSGESNKVSSKIISVQ